MAKRDLQFVQIIVGGGGGAQLYGLDKDGQVWVFFDNVNGWRKVCMETAQ